MRDQADITIVLDRSGSMGEKDLQRETINNFNVFLADQKKLGKPAYFSLVQFDHEYILESQGWLADAKPLNVERYVPRGSTALLDAIGKTIKDTGDRLAQLAPADRPRQVIVAIITDGYENFSTQYKKQQIADMIKLQSEVYKWTFYFLGANMDAIGEAQALNIQLSNAAPYGATGKGIHAVYSNLSASVSRSRTTGQAGTFTSAEQDSLFSTADPIGNKTSTH